MFFHLVYIILGVVRNMWLNKGCKNLKEIKRDGLVTSIVLPTDSDILDKKYGLKISKRDKKIRFDKGKDVYIITDKIGINELCEFSVFFMSNFMVIELQKGFIYLKDENDVVYRINNKNKIDKIDDDSVQSIWWKDSKEISEYCKRITKSKFNLIRNEDVLNYFNNLIFTINSYFSASEGNLFIFKFLDFYYDLGLEKFNYEVKEKVEVKVEVPEYKTKSFQEDKYVKDLEFKANAKINVKSSKTLSDEEDENDDVEILPIHMHEIDIFNDYLSEDEENS